MKREKIILLLIRGLMILGFIAIFLFLLAQDMVWSGRLEIKSDFTKFSPFFSILKPQPRIIMQQVNTIIGEPIWFDVSLPRDFEKATLHIEYRDDYNYKMEIGPNIGANWDFKPLTNEIILPDGYKISTVSFDMTKANINNGKLRFTLNIPGLTEDETIYIRNVDIVLERPSIFQQNLVQNLTDYITYARNQFKN